MTVHVAMPSRRRGQKLAFSFDEDDLTLSWDAVAKAGLKPGARLHCADVTLPPWFWQGTGLLADPDAPWTLRAIPTTLGPAVAVHPSGAIPDIEDVARKLHAATPQRTEPEWQRHRTAREGPDTEADFPLGAFVPPARHHEVTAQRLRLGGGVVRSWTTIGAGAAPTEFLRLQDAVGAYHVVLVDVGGAATVGLWAGEAAPAVGQSSVPVLRRLFRTQGTWRHGVKFTPA